MDGVADNFTEGDGGARETREVRAREADKTRREVDGVADNFTEGDKFPERRCRTGKTGKKRSGEAREILETEETREVRAGEARKILETEENAAVLEKLEKNGAFASTSGVRNFLSKSETSW